VKRGVTLSVVAITGAISANSVQAAPVELAISAVAAAKGTVLTASTLPLVKGTLKLMTWMKVKLMLGMGVAILMAASAVTVAVTQINTEPQNLTPQEIARKSQAAYAALSSYSDEGKIVEEIGGQTLTTTFSIRLQRPNFYRVEWIQATTFFTNGGVVWSAGNGNFLMVKHGQYSAKPQPYQDMQTALGAATGISGQASATIPSVFFNQNGGNALKINPAKSKLQRLKDEKIGDVDCYVLSIFIDPINLPNAGNLIENGGKIGKTTRTLWVGKQDYLIHQYQTIVDSLHLNTPQMSDAELKMVLDKPNHPATPEAIAAKRTQFETAYKKVLSMMASGKIVSTQTHENITMNGNFSTAEFSQ
jgi:outer membrane lipoprotein-sorting protein